MSNYPRDEFDAIEENSARHGVHRASMEIAAALPDAADDRWRGGAVHRRAGILHHAQDAWQHALRHAACRGQQHQCARQPRHRPRLRPPRRPPRLRVELRPHPHPRPTPWWTRASPWPFSTLRAYPAWPGGTPDWSWRDGWTVSQSANWAGQPQPTSVIFYNGIAQKANAEALSKAAEHSHAGGHCRAGHPAGSGPGARRLSGVTSGRPLGKDTCRQKQKLWQVNPDGFARHNFSGQHQVSGPESASPSGECPWRRCGSFRCRSESRCLRPSPRLP